MSIDGNLGIPKMTKYEQRQAVLHCRYEFYVQIGSTFTFMPELSINSYELFAFDWLWIHIGLIRFYDPKKL